MKYGVRGLARGLFQAGHGLASAGITVARSSGARGMARGAFQAGHGLASAGLSSMSNHPIRSGASALALGGGVMYRRRSAGRNGLNGQSSGGMYY